MVPGLRSKIRQLNFPVSLGIAVATILVSAAGLLRESVLAATFGVGTELDTVVIVFAISLLVGNALVSTAIGALVPELVRTFSTPEVFRALVGRLLVAAGLFGLVLGGVIFACADPLAGWIAGSDGSAQASQAIKILGVAVPPAFGIRGVLSATLNSASRFVLASAVPGVSALAVAVAAVGVRDVTVIDLSVALAFGLAVEILVLYAGLFRLARPKLYPAPTSSNLVGLSRRACYAFGGAVVFGAGPSVDYLVANRLASGSAAIIGLATRLPVSLAGLVVAVLVTQRYTSLSQKESTHGRNAVINEGISLARRYARYGVVVAIFSALIGIPFAHIFYGHGAMDGDEVRRIINYQFAYSAVIPAYIAVSLSIRTLLVCDGQDVAFRIGFVAVTVNLVLDVLGAELIGLIAIPIATTVVYLATWYLMERSLDRKRQGANRAGQSFPTDSADL